MEATLTSDGNIWRLGNRSTGTTVATSDNLDTLKQWAMDHNCDIIEYVVMPHESDVMKYYYFGVLFILFCVIVLGCIPGVLEWVGN